MSKSVQKIEARKLRSEGNSIKKIAKKLEVAVSSVSNWCRDIELTNEQKEVLESNARNPYYAGRGLYLKKLNKQTKLKTKRLQKKGIRKIGQLTKRELFLTGAALYWAEGFKKDTQVGLASMDPEMSRFFVKWLKVCFGYKNKDLIVRVTANISHKNRIEVIERYWSKLLKLPLSHFRKPFFQNFAWKKTYENPEEYYGVLRIKVRKSKDFLRQILGFIGGLKLNAK